MKKEQLLQKLSNECFDQRIVKAFKEVEREDFIPGGFKKHAYEDVALTIGYGQTISQPFTIAFMLTLLEIKNEQRILEVGSGSGYVLALLNELSKNSKIFGVERIEKLVESSKRILHDGKNIKIFQAGEKLGLSEQGPFDRILVSASAQSLPSELLDQLTDEGILVCPVQNHIIKIKKEREKIVNESFYGFTFVPLVK